MPVTPETQPRGSTAQQSPSKQKASKRRRPLVPENDIRAAILDWLAVAGVPCAVTDAAVYPGERPRVTEGWPDITACLVAGFTAGLLVAIEVKRADGTLRPAQRTVLGELEACGAVVIIARSLSDVVERMASLCPEPVICGSPRVSRLWRAIDAYRKGHGAK